MVRLSLVKLLIVAVSISLFSLAQVRGSDDPMRTALLEAHDLLIKAIDETDAAQRASDMRQAREAILHSAPGRLGPHRKMAVDIINSALYELRQGDPKSLVQRYIEDANRQLDSASK